MAYTDAPRTFGDRRQANVAQLRALARQEAYRNVQAVVDDYGALATECPFLAPGTGRYPKYPQSMIKLQGTVGMTFNGTKYDIPMTVWLPKTYPAALPVCYVNVPPGMQLAADHGILVPNGSGECTLPPHFRAQPGCLIEVVRYLQFQFARKPPLYAQPVPSPPPQPFSAPAYHAPPPTLNPYAAATSPPASAGSHYDPTPAKPPPEQVLLDDPVALLSQHLRKQISEKLHALAKDLHESTEAEVRATTASCEALETATRQAERDAAAQKTQAAAEAAELARVRAELAAAQEWLAAHRHMAEDPLKLMPEEALDAQIMELEAEKAALEDMLHLLGQEETDAKTLTKNVTRLAHKKFEVVHLLKKAVKARHKGG